MEKYTVDLDQVLNDFEYNELTDQYNSDRAASTNNSSKISQNNHTKHSINNVFHSLNEYLHTNINNGDTVKIDNNFLTKNDNLIENNIKKHIGDVIDHSNEEKQSKTDKNLIEEPYRELNLSLDVSKSVIDAKKDDNQCLNDENQQSNESLNENRFEGENLVEKHEEIAFESENGVKLINESDNNESGINLKCEKDVDLSVNEENMEEERNVDVKEEETVEFSEKTEEIEKITEKEEEEEEVQKEEDNTNQIDTNKENTTTIQDNIQSDPIVENNSLDTVIPLVDQNLTEKEEEEEVKTIGFVDDMDMDDTELNKMLEELENEVDLEESMVEEKKSEDEELKKEKETLSNNTVNENSPSSPKPIEDVSEESVKEEEEVAPVVQQEKLIVLKNEEIRSRKVSIESVESKSGCKMDKNDSEDSLSRPQDLPLNNEVAAVEKKKINLIGDPGSTPYNNVYVNNEIPKGGQQESDTEYSCSASPTFSDISTESTSTTSTASIQGLQFDNSMLDSPPISTGGEKLVIGPKDEAESNMVNENLENTNPFEDDAAASGNIQNLENDNIANTISEGTNGNTVTRDTGQSESQGVVSTALSDVIGKAWLGKEAPLWIPDADAMTCLHCDMKFTVLKRRHHCRACGLVLCSKCCNLRFKLEYLDAEARVCNKCYDILNRDTSSTSGSEISPEAGNSPAFRPNPNNPLEYCSTVSPLQQVSDSGANPPSVMVPVGVLKRKGSNKSKSTKSVMFCDGIKPGSDLTNLDSDFNYKNVDRNAVGDGTDVMTPPVLQTQPPLKSWNLPRVDPDTKCFIPGCETSLPPTVAFNKTDISYTECSNRPSVVEMLKNEELIFAINVNLYVRLKIINMDCCINKRAWCFSTEGLINVGNDEIVILIEYIPDESFVPKDVFFHIYNIYADAVKGTTIKELGISLHNTSCFLDSKNHAGFIYVRPTFQCLENIIKPSEPFLIGILIHRWETPWAKLFPLRLVLRLGAEYRYYPSPVISTRHRDSTFVEIGHTIINLLADFRNFSYTLPQIRGLTIHMENKNTTLSIPRNRYDQVMKSMNNSSDHILAFAGNFSVQADSHLVCIQDTQSNDNTYSTHAINIHKKPRKVTGVSFIVFNGALKTSSGLTAKSNIVEDGLMIQVLPETMEQIRDSLRAMKNHVISCGCVNATADETVNIVWTENDVNFNLGVKSPVDNSLMNGIPSIRVHSGKDYIGNGRLIRWTEVFIIQNGEENSKNQDPVDISKVSESIAKATCNALVKYLDLLVTNNFYKIGIRTTLHVENVSYSAGSNGVKLPPIYMKSLDNELIPVLHRITSNNMGENAVVLELIFRILNV